MRKLSIFFTMLLIIILNNFSFGQQNRSVYIIGSTFSVSSASNVCYPATPVPIRSDPATNNTDASLANPSNSNLYTTSPIADLGVVIANAYARGFRHFYFQEGIYIISTSINLNNLNGITIEGTGAGTVFKPSSTTLTTIFDVNNCSNCKIKNIGIDLKTTLTCGSGQDPNDASTGIKIGANVGRCLFEDIFFKSNIDAVNATVGGLSPILVHLNTGEESDYNTFNNIQFKRSLGGIVLNINGGIFNHNAFSNIHLDLCTVGVAFTGTGGIIEGNLFSNFDVQADSRTAPVSGELRRRTVDIVQNIRGLNNTFQNFNIADFNPCTTVDAPNGCPRVGYVFSITAEAERTVIENTETEGVFVSPNDARSGWYIDNGIGTQFVNNASTNRLTDYIKNNLSDVIFTGQNSPNPISDAGGGTNFDVNVANSPNRNYFRVDNFGSVTFNGRTQNLRKAVGGAITQDTYLGSIVYAENYGSYTFGNFKGGSATTNPFTATGSLFTIKGRGQFQPHVSGIYNFLNNNTPYSGAANLNPTITYQGTTYNIPLSVLTNADNNGTLQWTKVSDILSGGWNHIATKNINMAGFALTNNSNAATTTNADAGLRLDNSGNVRIGTTAPEATNPAKLQVDGRVIVGNTSTDVGGIDPTYNLIVNGKAYVKTEVLIKSNAFTWPDYVFKNNYRLMPLKEVENCINTEGHLPNMPTAAQVESQGLPLSEMMTKQQEKIEELTLYLIEMKKLNDMMQKKIEVLEQKLKN